MLGIWEEIFLVISIAVTAAIVYVVVKNYKIGLNGPSKNKDSKK